METINAIEKNPSQENLQIIANAEIKDRFGVILSRIEEQVLEANTPFKIPPGAYEVDGYFNTRIGDFAIQDLVLIFQEFLINLKEYLSKKEDLENQKKSLEDVLAEKQNEQQKYGPQSRTENFKEWSRIGREIEKTINDLDKINKTINFYENKLSKYKI